MFSEATVGYRKDKEVANRWVNLFTTPYFLVSVVSFSTISS
jgi:glycerol-3-phosphate dehydrogenase (NAD+)